MSDNMKIWSVLEKTDPSHTKAFQRSGGFKGTAIKPIYCDKRMTELFGPCGEGWGIGKPEFQVVSADKEILVFCTVGVWHGTRENIVYGVGGDKVLADQSKGLKTSDEAFKMAFTDAIGNAYKHLGMSADIHMGRFDDAKYLEELKEEFGGEEKTKSAPTPDEYVTQATATIRNPKVSVDDLVKWWEDEAPARRAAGLTQDHVDILKREMKQRKEAKEAA